MNVFLTGCDKNTEWMLQWWYHEYSKYNTTPVIFANFGVSHTTLSGQRIIFMILLI